MISVTNRFGVAVASLIMLLASLGRADVINKWTFENKTNTPPDIGSGTSAYIGGTKLSSWPAGYDTAVASWSIAGFPAQGTGDKTAGLQFNASTAGYTNIVVSLSWMPSATSSTNALLRFSADGSNWNDWSSPMAVSGGSSWSSKYRFSFSLSNFASVANCPGFSIQVVAVLASGSYVGNSAYNAGSCTWRFDDVTISGAPMVFAPTIAITTPSSNALTVANALTSYDLAGTSSNLVGNLAWANALTASAGTLPASTTWSISGVALGVGGNVITVSGTNAAGNSASAAVTITRQAPPSLTITNPAAAFWAVDADTTNVTLAGTSSSLSGSIQWTNALTGAAGSVAGAASWSIAGVALAPGTNAITATANSGALTVSVQLVRLPAAAWLKSGDIALIGWDDTQNSNRFSFVTLTALPSGSVIYFTDNGWSNTQYRGASANGGDGNETLLKFLVVQPVPPGTIIHSSDTSASFEWLRGDTIPGGGTTKFKDLVLSASGGDQISVFQAPSANPLWSATVQLFMLDDSGAFEDATDVYTGNTPPGLIAGLTALTFAQAGSSQHVMIFTNFDGRARNKMAWLACIANSNNWFFGASGDQPSGAVTVAPPPMLTVQPYPVNAGTATGGGQYDTADLVTLTATPLRGWAFARWSDGNTHANRTLSMSASDTTITAFFMWPSSLLLLR